MAVLLAAFPGGEDASRYRAGAHQRMDLLLKALRREEVVLFRRRQQHVLFYQVSKGPDLVPGLRLEQSYGVVVPMMCIPWVITQ